MTYLVQHYSRMLRPGSAQDGPPYPRPGDYVTQASKATLADAVKSVARIVAPTLGQAARNPDDWRIVKVNRNGRIIGTYDASGEPPSGLATVRKRRQLVAV